MLDIPCILFAGGKSSRMGEDKALLPFGNFPTLTQYQLHKLQKSFKNVYISCKDKRKFSFHANFIEDVQANNVYAPTTGFIACFEKLKTEKIFVISVDTPFITEDIINKLILHDTATSDATIALLDSKLQPMCGIYHRSLKSTFLNMLEHNNHKLGYLLKSSHTNYVTFEDKQAFLNLNNQDDYKKALTLI